MQAHATAVPAANDPLAAALCTAELGEPFDLDHASTELLRELFAAVPKLRVCVPFATLRLLARLAGDPRAEVRLGVARAMPWFAELYAERVEELLLPLACDSNSKVRAATVGALADLLELSADPWPIVERWQWHPDRARDVLARARALLPSPLGTR
jgi:hypothetical protein